MQGKCTSKMSLGFAFALLLTLQSLQLVSTQTSNVGNEELTNPPVIGITEDWKKVTEEDFGISSDSISGDDEYQASNVTVTAETAQFDLNMTTTPSSETTLHVSSNTTATTIQQNSTSKTVTTNPDLGSSTTNDSHVNLTETYTTAPNPGNSTTTATTANITTASTPAFNTTQNSTSTVSRNLTTTSSPPAANYTHFPNGNSTNTTVSSTTSTLNYTSVVLFNESTTASTAITNETEGAFNIRENVDKDLSSDIQQTKSQAWGAILGIGVGVAIVAMVIYIIVKRRNYRDFSHRKLVEDMAPEPVLRLDNTEPLDLKFDGSAYYNPGLQGDNIQMTNFPHGHTN